MEKYNKLIEREKEKKIEKDKEKEKENEEREKKKVKLLPLNNNNQLKQSSPEYLINFISLYKDKFSTIERNTPSRISNMQVSIYDIKFSVKMQEDKIYKNDLNVQETIRRGNTIAKLQTTNEYITLRKGLKKFFDYSDDIMKEVYNYIDNNKEIVVFRTYKANGENLQISYSNKLESWIICSKNVALAVKDKTELNEIDHLYKDKKENEYSYCIYFSQRWFDYLNLLEKNDLNTYEQLKNDLNGYTLIGESVGDINHEHIKLYSNPEFQFYAMVDNNSEDNKTCISINKTISFLKKYNLKFVDYEKSPVFNSRNQLLEYIKLKYNEVLLSPIEKEGEGNVIYFTNKKKDINKEDDYEVILLCKLKTFEYRFLRKLREKLKSFVKEKMTNENKLMESIKREIYELLDDTKIQKYDLSSFLNFGFFVFKYIKDYNIHIDFNKYGTLINQLRNEYSIKKEKIEIQPLINKDSFKLKMNESNSNIEQSNHINNIRTPYLIFSIGCVGSGKSKVYHILNQLIKEKFSGEVDLYYVSSDEIMSEHMKILKKENSLISNDEAFDKLRGKVKNEFNNKVKSIISGYNSTLNREMFIYLDKNFPLKDFNKNFSFSKTHPYKVIILYPKISNCLSFLPFSMDYIVQCYQRIKYRDHLTLDGSTNEKFYFILFFFLYLNKGSMSFSKEDSQIQITNTDESHSGDGNEYEDSDVVNSLKKIMSMSNNILFKNDDFNDMYSKDIDICIQYFEKRISEIKFQNTEDVIKEELDLFLHKFIENNKLKKGKLLENTLQIKEKEESNKRKKQDEKKRKCEEKYKNKNLNKKIKKENDKKENENESEDESEEYSNNLSSNLNEIEFNNKDVFNYNLNDDEMKKNNKTDTRRNKKNKK